MPVTLESRMQQILVMNLPHDSFCRGSACACSEITAVVVDENPRTGDRAPRRVVKRAPSSLTLLSREVRRGVPEAVLRAPDVQAAVARGHVRVVEQTPDPAPGKAGV